MKAILQVPQPCAESWEEMSPGREGRHCTLCAHTVIDFTQWALPDIIAYLQAHRGQRVCGRFHNNQLQQPFDLQTLAPQVMAWQAGRLRKIAAVIILCFAVATTSCSTGNDHKAAATEEKQERSKQEHPDATLGMVPAPARSDTLQPPPVPVVKVAEPRPPVVGSADPEYVTTGAPVMREVPEAFHDSLWAGTAHIQQAADGVQEPAADTTYKIMDGATVPEK